jgi:hypothetical protein
MFVTAFQSAKEWLRGFQQNARPQRCERTLELWQSQYLHSDSSSEQKVPEKESEKDGSGTNVCQIKADHNWDRVNKTIRGKDPFLSPE